jgi:hypothetical protein
MLWCADHRNNLHSSLGLILLAIEEQRSVIGLDCYYPENVFVGHDCLEQPASLATWRSYYLNV